MLREHEHYNFFCRHAVPFLRSWAALHLALSPMLWQSPASDRLNEVLPSPSASFGTCFCLQLPTQPCGKLTVKTVLKALENDSALKNTSENGCIINGPAVSTIKSRWNSEARFSFNEAVLVQASNTSIWKRCFSQIISPSIEKSR